MARILVVDDSSIARSFTTRVLGEKGHEARTVDPRSCFDVLQAARDFRPDLVITDYRMPHCSAETLVRSLREDPLLGEIPIMVFTAHHEQEVVDTMMARGVDEIVFKGNTDALLQHVRHLLEGR
jgi:CheY-like chemotaxis protein